MADLLSKRSREDEPFQASSPKRFRAEEQVLCLFEEDESFQENNCRDLDVRRNIEQEIENVDGWRNIEGEIEHGVDGRINIEEDLENFVDGRRNIENEMEKVVHGRSYYEGQIDEVVNGVMRSLEQEIGLTCSSSDLEGSYGSSVLSTDELMINDMDNRGGIDVEYLLEASDDELGLPPSPLLDADAQPASPLDQSFSDFPQNAELKSFLENWHFEDEFVDFNHFSDDAEIPAWDIFSQAAFIDGDYSVAAAGAIY